MKKRRNLIVALLLIATMVVGIGYAALSRDLVIEGSADLGAATKLDVQFVGHEVTSAQTFEKGTDKTVATADHDTLTASYEITGLKTKNDTVTMTFTVQNMSDALANLTGVIDNDGTLTPAGTVTEYFDRTVTITHDAKTISWTNAADAPDDATVKTEGIVLEPTETATVVITVTLKQTVGATTSAGTVPESIQLGGSTITLKFADEVTP